MSISISNSLTPAAFSAASATTNVAAAQTVQQPANNSAYVVRLSEAEQVYQLSNQGQSVPQIATSLSLSVAAVNSYLGVSNSQ